MDKMKVARQYVTKPSDVKYARDRSSDQPRKKFFITVFLSCGLAVSVILVLLFTVLAPMIHRSSHQHNGILLTASPSFSFFVPKPSNYPTPAPSSVIVSYLRTSGNQIIDESGKVVRITGVNW